MKSTKTFITLESIIIMMALTHVVRECDEADPGVTSLPLLQKPVPFIYRGEPRIDEAKVRIHIQG